VLDTAEALIDHDPKGVLLAVERLSSSGRDIAHFMQDLSEHLRHLFVVQTLGEVPATFAVTAEHTDRLDAQADRLPQAEVLRAIDLLARARSAVKDGSEPRIQLELALLKAVQPQADLSIQALLFRIEQLERRLEAAGSGEGVPRAAAAPQEAPDPPLPPPPPAPRASGPAAAAAPQAVAAPQEQAAEELDVELVRGLWPAAVEAVSAENAMVAAALGKARPTSIENGTLTVTFPEGNEFACKTADRHAGLLQGALRTLVGRSVGVSLELGGAEQAEEAAEAPPLSEDELLERLKAEFKAEEVFDDDDDEGT
jgi:DNA polymerase-3 subunit gamma/tau